MTNKRELPINAVKNDRLKMLISLNQKVCGGLLLYSLGAHGQTATGGEVKSNPSC
nr:hypothetical protein [Citrobacter freundii]